MNTPDVAIVGGGIVGTSAAAHLAARGVKVRLYERAELGAGASGRNSGSVLYPFKDALVPLYKRTVELLHELAGDERSGFTMPAHEAGVLLLSEDERTSSALAVQIRSEFPEMEGELLSPEELAAVEPNAGPALTACRLGRGYVVPPGGATHGFARIARAYGAEFHTAKDVTLWEGNGEALGLFVDGEQVSAGAVLVCAGAWSSELLTEAVGKDAISPLWGVVASVRLPRPSTHVLEEAEIALRQLNPDYWSTVAPAASDPGADPSIVFGLVTVDGVSALGSSLDADLPSEATVVPKMVSRGRQFVPALATAETLGVRSCPRPVSRDGLPLLGAVAGMANCYIASGHSSYGISTGPASAALVGDLMLGAADAIPDVFFPGRFVPSTTA